MCACSCGAIADCSLLIARLAIVDCSLSYCSLRSTSIIRFAIARYARHPTSSIQHSTFHIPRSTFAASSPSPSAHAVFIRHGLVHIAVVALLDLTAVLVRRERRRRPRRVLGVSALDRSRLLPLQAVQFGGQTDALFWREPERVAGGLERGPEVARPDGAATTGTRARFDGLQDLHGAVV